MANTRETGFSTREQVRAWAESQLRLNEDYADRREAYDRDYTSIMDSPDDESQSHCFGSGMYGGVPFFSAGSEIDIFTEPSLISPLAEVELVIASQIADLIKENDGNPVIMLDYGAMGAASLIRLAKHFEQEVIDGKVIFVASDLKESTAQKGNDYILQQQNEMHTREYERTFPRHYSEEQIRYIRENQHLIVRVWGDALSLATQSVSTPDGSRTIPLLGNVSIVHERRVLIHSIVPEIDCFVLCNLLSSRGTLYMSSIPSRDYDVSDIRIRPSWKTALLQGIDYITTSEVTCQYTGAHYLVFSRSEAPDVQEAIERTRPRKKRRWPWQ